MKKVVALVALVCALLGAGSAAAAPPVVSMEESARAVKSWEAAVWVDEDPQWNGPGGGVRCVMVEGSVTYRFCRATFYLLDPSDSSWSASTWDEFRECKVVRTKRLARHRLILRGLERATVRVRKHVEMRCGRLVRGPWDIGV